MSFTVAVYALLFALRGLPLEEIVLGIPPGCDTMKSFCTVVPNSSAWCLLISATATWPVMMLYRWLDDNVSGWEYFCSSAHILWRSDTSSCLPFDPFPLCFFSFGPCLLVRIWIHIIMHIIIKGINGLRANLKEGNLHSNLVSIGRDVIETASTSTLSGIGLLCTLVFWYRHADTSVSTVCS